MSIDEPVMKLEASESSNIALDATSSGFPRRPNGIFLMLAA